MAAAFLLTAAAIFAADRRIKNYIEKNKKPGCSEKRLHGLIIVRHTRNSGMVMNLLDKRTKLVTAVSAAVFALVALAFLLILPRKGMTMLKFGLSLLAGGAAGNVYDRVRRGYVVDYFSFPFLKRVIFNISDIFVIAGALISAAGAS